MTATGMATPIPILAPVDSPFLKPAVLVDVEMVALEVDGIVVDIKVLWDATARGDDSATAILLKMARLVSSAATAAERDESREASSVEAALSPRSDDSAANTLLRMAGLVAAADATEVKDAS